MRNDTHSQVEMVKELVGSLKDSMRQVEELLAEGIVSPPSVSEEKNNK